jgi:hypothetical protein
MSLLRKLAALAAFATGAGALAFSGWALHEALTADDPAIEYLVFAAPVVIVIIGLFTLLAWALGWYLWHTPPAEGRQSGASSGTPVRRLQTRPYEPPHVGPRTAAGSGAGG